MTNITIPSHLLANNEPGKTWHPDAAPRRDTLDALVASTGVVPVYDRRERGSIQRRSPSPELERVYLRPEEERQYGRGRSSIGRISISRGSVEYRSSYGLARPSNAVQAYVGSESTQHLQRPLSTVLEIGLNGKWNLTEVDLTDPALSRTSSPVSFVSRRSKTETTDTHALTRAQADPAGQPAPPTSKPARNDQLLQQIAAYDFAQASQRAPNPARASGIEDEESVDPSTNPSQVTLDRMASPVGARPDSPTEMNAFQRSASIAQAAVQTAAQGVARAFSATANDIADVMRKSSVAVLLDKAKVRKEQLQRTKWVQKTFEYSCYALIVLFVYFVLVGVPLWRGAVMGVYWIVDNKFTIAGTWSVTIGLAVIYAYLPLMMLFERDPPMPDPEKRAGEAGAPGTHNTALLIPCYKAAGIIGPTLEAAKKVFPASHIFVVANGNSTTPLDNTEEVCLAHNVNHVWSPIGSKIVAQFVGCHVVAKSFENVLMIDDDCALPPNFPIVSDRMHGRVKCVGYTIKSVGPNSSPGTWCQQAQDLEYKLSGMQRAVAGVIGSATFPHGAISIWNIRFLIDTLNTHPGFNVSEDWFFGHNARELGCRIKMCTAVFVETETPDAVFFPAKGGARGGFGEMTVFKQRFYRWNFFFVNGLWYNMKYILLSWRLGWWEIGAKLFVLQEVYETLLYLLAPFVLPISLVVRPDFCAYLLAGTFGLYWLNALIFNELHLRLRNERVGIFVTYVYYHLYKIALTGVNILSCYYALYKYARYFAVRHPKVVENERALEVVLRLEEERYKTRGSQARRFTVTAIAITEESPIAKETIVEEGEAALS